MIAFLDAHRAGLFRRDEIWRNVVAGVVHSVFLILVIVLFAPWAAHIPLAALAAILFYVAWNMSDVRHFSRLLTRAAFRPAGAADQFMRRMAESVSVQQEVFGGLEDRVGGGETSQDVALPPNVLVYRIDGPFFFGAVSGWCCARSRSACPVPSRAQRSSRWSARTTSVPTCGKLRGASQPPEAVAVARIKAERDRRKSGTIPRSGDSRSSVLPGSLRRFGAPSDPVQPPRKASPNLQVEIRLLPSFLCE